MKAFVRINSNPLCGSRAGLMEFVTGLSVELTDSAELRKIACYNNLCENYRVVFFEPTGNSI